LEVPEMDAATPQRALTIEEAAAYVGLSTWTLDKLRSRGGGPPYIKLGRRVVYLIEDLNGWLATRRRTSTSDLGAGAEFSGCP
jgi:predicted DNA-binding transcriptional regulator AlpA